MWSRRRSHACAWVCVVVLAGCTGSNPSDGPDRVSETPVPTEVPSAAGDLRVELEALFGLHAHLTTEAIRGTKAARGAGVAAAEDAARALAEALTKAVSDDSSADDLGDAWSEMTGALIEAGGGPSSDAAIDEAVTATLDLVGEGPDEEGLEDLLRAPLNALARHAESVQDKQRDKAYELARQAYAEMVTAGGAVAAGITEADPQAYPGRRNSGALELRSALRQLLGEHALLAVTVTRRGAKAAPDFDAAAAALNGNTTDISDALESIYESPGPALEAQWRNRIALLAKHAAALGDQRGKDVPSAREAVEEAADAVGDALAQGTDRAVKPAKVAAALRKLDAALLEQTEAFVAADLTQADAATQDAFARALKLADVLAQGIARQQPDEFPST